MWIQKSEASSTEDLEMSKVPGLEKVKILRSVIERKLVQRLVTGEIITSPIDNDHRMTKLRSFS